MRNVFYIDMEVGDSSLMILSSLAATPTGFNLGLMIEIVFVPPGILIVLLFPLVSSNGLPVSYCGFETTVPLLYNDAFF